MSTIRGGAIAVIISLVLILAAAGASLFVVRGVDEQLADVATTYEVRRQARELILAITDAETGQRGYLLTQDERYLVPYEQATGSLDESYDALVGLLAANARTSRRSSPACAARSIASARRWPRASGSRGADSSTRRWRCSVPMPAKR